MAAATRASAPGLFSTSMSKSVAMSTANHTAARRAPLMCAGAYTPGLSRHTSQADSEP